MRSRCAFRLGENVLIDMGPDLFSQSSRCGDLTGIDHILVTHTHEDHFCSDALNLLRMSSTRKKPLHLYLTGDAFLITELLGGSKAFMKGALNRMTAAGMLFLHHLSYGTEYTVGDYRVTPLKGHHFGNMDEHCANYLIRLPDDRLLYYGTDTGQYEEETLALLKDRAVSVWISECTYGDGEDTYPDPGHLSFSTMTKMMHTLIGQGSLAPGCRIYLTHINHLHTAHHAKLEEMCRDVEADVDMKPAYDGLRITV